MSKKIYIIFQHQDQEDDHGEPQDVSKPVEAFTSEDDAKKYIKEHDYPYVYRVQYGDYYTNHYDYAEVPLNKEDEPVREQIKLGSSETTKQFNERDLKNIKNCLISALYRSDNEEEVMTYSRTLTKVDDILETTQQED